jgi:hypothetical protein
LTSMLVEAAGSASRSKNTYRAAVNEFANTDNMTEQPMPRLTIKGFCTCRDKGALYLQR